MQQIFIRQLIRPQLLVSAICLAAASLSACVNPQLQANDTAAHSGKILLMGEVHDNPDGHRQRFEDLQKLVQAGMRPALAMEQFDREDQPRLKQAQAQCSDADCLIQRFDTEKNGSHWEWAYYRPIIQLALDYQLPLLAANLSRQDAARIMREGYAAALDARTIQEYQLDQLLPVTLIGGQRAQIEAGHCGKMPSEMVPGMIRAQVARDIWMAKLIAGQPERDVVLLAGNGHVRRDLGVPRWLTANQQERMQIHAYLEADATTNSKQPAESGEVLYDITHVIAAHPRTDPCQAVAGSVQQKAME